MEGRSFLHQHHRLQQHTSLELRNSRESRTVSRPDPASRLPSPTEDPWRPPPVEWADPQNGLSVIVLANIARDVHCFERQAETSSSVRCRASEDSDPKSQSQTAACPRPLHHQPAILRKFRQYSRWECDSLLMHVEPQRERCLGPRLQKAQDQRGEILFDYGRA